MKNSLFDNNEQKPVAHILHINIRNTNKTTPIQFSAPQYIGDSMPASNIHLKKICKSQTPRSRWLYAVKNPENKDTLMNLYFALESKDCSIMYTHNGAHQKIHSWQELRNAISDENKKDVAIRIRKKM